MQIINPAGSRGQHLVSAILTLAVALALLAQMTAAMAGVLDRVRQSGKLALGYSTDARPFSYRDASGNPAGYSIALCQKIADQVKAESKLQSLSTEWVALTAADRFPALQSGKVDLLCEATSATLTARKDVSFSIPILPDGVGALLRADSSSRLRAVLTKGQAAAGPFWRASPAQILEQQTFSPVIGATSERWLAERLNQFHLSANVIPVKTYDEGIRLILERKSNVLFGDRAILVDAAKRNPQARDLVVLDRLFTSQHAALALARNDDDFRLVVDRTLSQLFVSPEFRNFYEKWLGTPDRDALEFFRQTALSD